MKSKFKVGDVIYQLQYKLNCGKITGILSSPYIIESIDEEREKITVVGQGMLMYLKYSISSYHVENQTLLCGEQQVATDAITEQYMWTTDIESGTRKMIENSIQSCNEIIRQFLDLGQQLFNTSKNNLKLNGG